MASILRFLGLLPPKRVAPPTVPTDEIMPMNYFDSISSIRSMVVGWTICFNDVLDPDKLRGGLEKLLSTGTWRKLGGRIRRNAQGKLELHVPAEFTPDRPAILYTHVSFSLPLAEHPLGSQFPRATPKLTVQTGPDVLLPLTVGSGPLPSKLPGTGAAPAPTPPTSLDDYLYSDAPQLTLRVVSFTDATLVTLAWPHTMTDALGRRALVQAWSAVLRGDEPEPLLGVQTGTASEKEGDPLATVGVDEPSGGVEVEEYVNDGVRVKGWRLIWYLVRFMSGVWLGPRFAWRTLCVPPSFMARLRREADSSLPPLVGGNAAENFVSDGDILTAWLTRMACTGLVTASSNRPVAVLNAFNLRGIMKSVFRPGGAYVQNAVFANMTVLRARELLGRPLGVAAGRMRASLRVQTTEAQVHAAARRMRSTYGPDGNGIPLLLGDKDAVLVIFSNWTKARFFDAIDFAPAVVKVGTPLDGVRRSNALGKPVLYVALLLSRSPIPIRNVGNILGKDAAGNYWVNGLFSERAWQAIEKAAIEAERG